MQGSPAQHPAIFVGWIFVLFAIVWVVVGVLIAWVSGWRSLAERYRTEREFPGHKRRMQSAQMRAACNYNNILTLASDAEGITMGLSLNMFLGHPRLSIPWADVRVEEPKRMLWVTTRTLRLGPAGIPLRVREPLAQFLLETMPAEKAQGPDGSVRWGIRT